jgi:hypothetical protein
MLARRRADDMVMATESRVGGFVTTVAATGAAFGLLLAGSGAGQSAPRACSAAARGLGACAPGALGQAKPYVTAALIGLLLGALIAIAAVLVWREARSAVALLGRHESTWPAAVTRPRGSLAPRARH